MPRGKREPMWRRYLRFFGPNVAADVNDEVDDHIARLESELHASGTPDTEIAAAVRERFGDPDAIRARLRRADQNRLKRSLWIDAFGNFGQDVAYALRRLRQRPGFTAAVVIVLALGVGATTAMFSAVDAAMLRPLPFAHPERLVSLTSVDVPFDPGPQYPTSPVHTPDLDDALSMSGTFSHVAAYAAGGLNLTGRGRPARVQAGVVTAGFFQTLGVLPADGRPFSAAEGKPNGPRAVILSYAIWNGHFGGRPMLDSVIALNGRSYTVVGVMPRGFTFPSESDLWIPMTNPTTFETFSAFRGFLPASVVARLADGVSPQAAGARLLASWERSGAAGDSAMRTAIAQRISDVRQTGAAVPLQRYLVGDHRRALLVLLAATGLLLLIACANVTNLLLSQAAVRRREIAVRAVLGATRARIIRQLLTESVLLAMGGTVVGVALAPLLLRLLGALMPPRLAGLAPAQLDGRVLGFAALLAVGTGIAFGLWPAAGSSRANLGETVNGGSGHGTTAVGAGLTRRLLVGAELALTLMLLIGSALMLRSFTKLMSVDSGLNPAHVATLEMSFGQDAGPWTARLTKMQAMFDRLSAVPGVEAAGAVNDLPLGKEGGISLRVTAQEAPRTATGSPRPYFVRYLIASGGYFQAMGIAMIKGRSFTPADDSLAPFVAVISRVMADSVWPRQDPIGRRFSLGMAANGKASDYTVIGVVDNVRVSGLDQAPGFQMYFSMYQQMPASVTVVARGTLPPAALMARLRDVVRAVDPSQAVHRVRMMDDVVNASVAPRRANTLLIALFGVLALVLAVLGVYAVVSYSVAQRRREFGIRAALGATRANLTSLVAREVLWVVILGIGVGVAGAWAASRVLASLLFGVTTHDPATFVLAPLALIIPAAIATLIPARRAARTNPMDVIRDE